MTSRSVSPGYWAACFVTRGKRARARGREMDLKRLKRKKERKTKKEKRSTRGTRKQVAEGGRRGEQERGVKQGQRRCRVCAGGRLK